MERSESVRIGPSESFAGLNGVKGPIRPPSERLVRFAQEEKFSKAAPCIVFYPLMRNAHLLQIVARSFRSVTPIPGVPFNPEDTDHFL
ncbi:MAG: hypothetical protein ABFS37_16480, partial [Acidobacteriota bacterium]